MAEVMGRGNSRNNYRCDENWGSVPLMIGSGVKGNRCASHRVDIGWLVVHPGSLDTIRMLVGQGAGSDSGG